MATINPFEESRQDLKEMNALTVYVKCSLNELKLRDPKGLYHRALLDDGHPDKVYNFTGISDPFEEPTNPDLVLDTENEDVITSVNKLYEFIVEKSD